MNNRLREVDRIEVLTLMDNYADVILGNTKVVRRARLAGNGEIFRDTLVGEHGLSLLVTVREGRAEHTILFDTGYSAVGVPHNMGHLGLDLKKIEAIALSHGHMDHLGALNGLLEKMPGPMPVLVHPDAFVSPRYLTRKDGGKDRFPAMLDRGEIENRGGRIKETATPTLICEDMIMVSGEVERTTTFERGMPHAVVERNGKLEKDDNSRQTQGGTYYPNHNSNLFHCYSPLASLFRFHRGILPGVIVFQNWLRTKVTVN